MVQDDDALPNSLFAMHDILTITLNPALDLSTSTETVQAGGKLRCDAPRRDPGGGGINVSRAIRILGGQSRAFVTLGGANGDSIGRLLDSEGITFTAFPAPGDTRQSLAVSDRTTGDQFRFVMPGPEWSAPTTESLLQAIIAAMRPDSIVVLSGSFPPGIPAGFVHRICGVATHCRARLVIDMSGEGLAALVHDPVNTLFALRMDQHEAETLNGALLPERHDTARFAQGLVRAGVAETVVVARGADGSVLATGRAIHHVRAADAPVLSKVGAGDSFVGAFALSLARNETLLQALRYGAAAASSAVMTDATELCRRDDTERFMADCMVERLG